MEQNLSLPHQASEPESAKLLEVKVYPNPVLKTVCEPVTEINQEIKTLVQNMFITMYHRNGVGLSANQVGITKRIFVMDTSNSGLKRYVFINPEIIEQKEIDRWKEGCLSFPGVFAYVKRPQKIRVRAQDENGNTFELDLQGLDAVCFQHELDHLNGITFYDHLSPLQKTMVSKKISKIKK